MEYKLKNKSKMRNYLNQRIGKMITEEQFQDCINNFVEFAEFIKNDPDGFKTIHEGASTEVEIDDEYYEVWVTYNIIIKDGIEIVLIDFDYTREEFVAEFGI